MNLQRAMIDASIMLADMGVKFDLVGSAVYSDKPKDLDFAVLVEENYENWCRLRVEAGWSYCVHYEQTMEQGFLAVRKGDINLIVSNSREWYEGYILSAHVCAALNLQSKADRVRVHRVIRDGMEWQTARDAPMREGVAD